MRLRIALLSLVLLAVVLPACKTLPSEYEQPPNTFALPPATEGILARTEASFAARNGPGRSGFRLIDRNDEALRWRLALIDSAQTSLDIQYYIWQDDESGVLLAHRVLLAADRGVKVRILIDDMLVVGNDDGVADAVQHPNIDIRIYNPWRKRDRLRILGSLEFIFRMKRLNQRMHNKLIVADGRFGIMGGRNLGDEYFGLATKYNFNDLDVLVTGPITREMSRWFDRFWNSERNVPGEMLGDSSREKLEKRRKALDKDLRKSKYLVGFRPFEPHDWTKWFGKLPRTLHSGTAEILGDAPDKKTGVPPRQYDRVFTSAKRELKILAAYFIPKDAGIEGIRETVKRGVRVRILTNSLGSNDVPVSNSGYKPYREAILDAGAELYEARYDAAVKPDSETAPVTAKFLGFHVKSIISDRRWVYIGSLNLDPRSAFINTEAGLWIDCPALAAEAADLGSKLMNPDNAWQVKKDEDGLYWECSTGTTRTQPARTWGQRFADWFFTLLPLEDQL